MAQTRCRAMLTTAVILPRACSPPRVITASVRYAVGTEATRLAVRPLRNRQASPAEGGQNQSSSRPATDAAEHSQPASQLALAPLSPEV